MHFEDYRTSHVGAESWAQDYDAKLFAPGSFDAAMWERYLASTRRSLTMMTEESGGFVIERANEPSLDLKRIGTQMR